MLEEVPPRLLTVPARGKERQFHAFRQAPNSKGAEATPSGWKPGKATRKPGSDLVGKVWQVWKTDLAFD